MLDHQSVNKAEILFILLEYKKTDLSAALSNKEKKQKSMKNSFLADVKSHFDFSLQLNEIINSIHGIHF